MAPSGYGGMGAILKAIAIFLATNWCHRCQESISIVTKDMRTLGKVTAATGLFGKGGALSETGVYGMLASWV
ncbi:hypothetical protein ECZC04_55600 [Escherichia coli]|nr:hypothetical protein ECZC04_55600 [Escherichia coli]